RSATKCAANVQPLHLARRFIDAAEGDAACDSIAARDENYFVVIAQSGELVLEILKLEIDSERCRIFENEFAHDGQIIRMRDGDHTSNSPRKIVTARPPRRTRSPSRRTRSMPPRFDA